MCFLAMGSAYALHRAATQASHHPPSLARALVKRGLGVSHGTPEQAGHNWAPRAALATSASSPLGTMYVGLPIGPSSEVCL